MNPTMIIMECNKEDGPLVSSDARVVASGYSSADRALAEAERMAQYRQDKVLRVFELREVGRVRHQGPLVERFDKESP